MDLDLPSCRQQPEATQVDDQALCYRRPCHRLPSLALPTETRSLSSGRRAIGLSAGIMAATEGSFRRSVTCFATRGKNRAPPRKRTVLAAEPSSPAQLRVMDTWSMASANREGHPSPTQRPATHPMPACRGKRRGSLPTFGMACFRGSDFKRRMTATRRE